MADQSHDEPATATHAAADTVTGPEVSDLDLRTSIEDTLWALDSIRVTKPPLEVAVHNGQATVSGLVNSPMMRAEITEALHGWPVELFILDDASVQNAAAYALAMDARTRSIAPGYRVQSLDGIVNVQGKFTPEQVQAIRDVASEVTGVKGVIIN